MVKLPSGSLLTSCIIRIASIPLMISMYARSMLIAESERTQSTHCIANIDRIDHVSIHRKHCAASQTNYTQTKCLSYFQPLTVYRNAISLFSGAAKENIFSKIFVIFFAQFGRHQQKSVIIFYKITSHQ